MQIVCKGEDFFDYMPEGILLGQKGWDLSAKNAKPMKRGCSIHAPVVTNPPTEV